MNPGTIQENPIKTADQQLADIKAQAAKIVQQAQKIDPAIKVSQADAEMIGLPKLRVPTQMQTPATPPELSRVGTTPIPVTGTDKAKKAILSQVPEEDRDTISAILDASMGLQTDRGAQLEGNLESLTTQRLDLAQSAKDRAVERGKLSTEARIPELEAELESIRGEADVLSARRNAAIQAEARREGVSTSAQNANINAIEKDFNLQQANLAIRELASVGKINAATRLIQTKLDIKYGDIEAETELVKAQIESILPLLSREDAKVAEQRLLLNDVARTTIADARESDKQLEEFKLQSYINAQQNGATPAVLGMIMSSDSREDVASVGGSFIQDPLEKLQMRQAEADIQNTYNAISDRNRRYELELMKFEQATVDAVREAQQQAATEAEAKAIENKAKGDKALSMLAAINELATHPGLDASVGPNPLARINYNLLVGGIFGEMITGDKSEFKSEVDRLANTLTLENMSLLKGPATDKDVEIVAASMSRLKNMDVTEKSYLEELGRLQSAAQRIVDEVGVTPEQLQYYGLAAPEDIQEVDAIWGVPSATNTVNIGSSFDF